MKEGIELEAITEDSGFHFEQEDNPVTATIDRPILVLKVSILRRL